MSEPTSAYTLQDMIRRVAIAAEIAYHGSAGSSRATIPVDEFNFDACLRCVNDGIKAFMSQAPQPSGWRWMNHIAEITFGIVETTGTVDAGDATSLTDDALSSTYDADDDVNGYYIYDKTQEIYALITDYTTVDGKVTVAEWLDYNDNASSLTPAASDSYSITDVKTVHGDKSRYYLPDDFSGEISGEITYAAGTGVGRIQWRSEGEVRKTREISKNTGYPCLAAVRRSPARRKWELFVSPSPTATDTILFPYKTNFNDLQAIVGVSTASGDTSVTIGAIANEYPVNYFKGWYAYVAAGTGRNSYAKITASAADGELTVADWLSSDGSAAGTNPGATGAYVMVCDNYKHPAGPQFDEVIMSAVLAKAEMEFERVSSPIPGLSHNEKFYKVDLPAAHQQDARSAPKRLGQMMPSSGRSGPSRNWIPPTAFS